MATVEELLVSLRIDPASVTKFLADVDAIKAKVAGEPVNIPVGTNAQGALAGAAGAATGLRRAGVRATSALRSGLSEVSAAASELRVGLLAVGAVAGFGLAQAIGLATEESRNLAAANVILQVSSEELTQIQEGLRRVAAETGQTFQTVSASLFDVASAGIKAEDALQVTSVAARVAAPANTDVATAFNSIATAMENFGFEADVAGDKLVRTADVSRATLGDLGDALATVGPIAGQLGISFEEVGASLAQLTKAGNNTAVSATLLNSVIRNILVPSSEATASFKKLGIATGETAFRNQTLLEVLQKISIEGPKAGIGITDLFTDARAIRGALALTADTANIATNIAAIGDASGRTQEALDAFFAQTGPQLDKLGAGFVNLLTVIGEDLLEALQPVIVAVTEFITDNQSLLSTLVLTTVALGALVLAVVGLDFAVRQVSAASRLLTGALTAASELLGLATAAFTTNTGAIVANAAARKESAAATAILTFLSRVRTLLATETGVLFANTLAWARNLAVRSIDILASIAARIAIVVGAIVIETIALVFNTKALFLNAIGRKTVLAATTPLSTALLTNVAALGAGTVALGVFAAAAAGFALGTLINDIFGLSDAFGKFTRTGEASAGALVAQFAILANPITATIFAFQELEKASVRAASAQLTSAQKALLANKANQDVLDETNRIQAQNIQLSRRQALEQALNESARIAFLQRLKTANKASAEDIKELARLEVALAKAIAESESELGKLNRAVQDRGKLQDQLKANEKDLAKVIKATNKEIIAARRGTEAAAIASARATFNARLGILRIQANIERALVEETQAQIDAARARGGDTGLEGLVAQLEKDQGKVRRTLDLVAQQFEVFSRRVTAEGQKRVTAFEQQAEKEIAAARKAADEVIAQEQRKADQAANAIRRLQTERDRGIDDATAFLDQLRQEAIQRIDPALAELRRFERDALEGLSGATAAQAEAAIGLIVQRLKELASATDAEVQAQAELNRLRDADDADDTEQQIERSLTRQEELQEKLGRLQTLRAVRTKAAEVAEKSLTAVAENAEQATQKRIDAIIAQQEKLRVANQKIADIKDQLAIKERIIQTELARSIRLTNTLTQANIEAGRVAELLSAALGKVAPDSAEAKNIANELKKAEARVKALERTTIEELDLRDTAQRATEAAAKKAFDALVESTKASQEREQKTADAAAALVPVADEAARLTAVAAESTQGLASSVDQVLKQQADLGRTTTDLATTTKGQLQAVGAEFARQDTRLRAVEREIANTRITPSEERAGGGL